ncbi:MAG: hypothetical protein AB1896_20260, partial [Thermodesulfobacteriota bacterium]
VPMTLHALYDFPLLSLNAAAVREVSMSEAAAAGLSLMTLCVLVFEWILAVKLTRSLRREQLTFGPAPVPRPARTSGWGLGLAGIIIGGLLATGGGLVALALALGLLLGGVGPGETGPLLVGGTILGLLPLGLGAWLFVWGVKRLNRTTAFTVPGDRDFAFK